MNAASLKTLIFDFNKLTEETKAAFDSYWAIRQKNDALKEQLDAAKFEYLKQEVGVDIPETHKERW